MFGPARLKVSRPEPAPTLPAYAGQKGVREVTTGPDRAKRVWGVRRYGAGPKGRQSHPDQGSRAGRGSHQAGLAAESGEKCRGSVRDGRAVQPMERRCRRPGGDGLPGGRRAGCAELTHRGCVPRTGSGRPPRPSRSRAAAAAPIPGPPCTALRPAPSSGWSRVPAEARATRRGPLALLPAPAHTGRGGAGAPAWRIRGARG